MLIKEVICLGKGRMEHCHDSGEKKRIASMLWSGRGDVPVRTSSDRVMMCYATRYSTMQ